MSSGMLFMRENFMKLRVKEEPSEVSFNEGGDGIMNDPSDHKNFQLLTFRDNLVLRIPRCDDMMIEFECKDVKPDKNLLLLNKVNQNKIKKEPTEKLKEEIIDDMAKESNSNFDGEVNNDIEIEFECQDDKPDKNLLLRRKLDNYSQNYLQNIADSSGCKPFNRVKKEPAEKWKEEIIGDTSEKSNFDRELNNDTEIVFEYENVKLSVDVPEVRKAKKENCIDGAEEMNLNCELVKQTKKKIITKKSDYQHYLNAQSDAVQSSNISSRKSSGKKCSQNSKLKIHIDTVHCKIIYECDVCKETFDCKSYLRTHIVSKHSVINFACDKCGKEYSSKSVLKKHIDAKHNKILHACNTCGKTFMHKSSLHTHINVAHKGATHKCGSCEKTFRIKSHLQDHIDSKHNGTGPKCEICGKIFSRKWTVKLHINLVHLQKHNRASGAEATYACARCEETFTRKDHLKAHMDSKHNKFV
ncbi:zinc finger protein 37-like [Trichogramma pretiosum]|uniref:zinc finger protein 37-like n=1 Tax=Trichogramma pretiosum TaxID=7493 RepID=UPI0006C95FFC|nr:zinc finger protein 37-like [Trichogramma pretiosum]